MAHVKLPERMLSMTRIIFSRRKTMTKQARDRLMSISMFCAAAMHVVGVTYMLEKLQKLQKVEKQDKTTEVCE